MTRVALHKTIIAGALKGLKINESIPFADWVSAASYADDMRGKTVRNPCGGSAYRVDFAYVEGN